MGVVNMPLKVMMIVLITLLPALSACESHEWSSHTEEQIYQYDGSQSLDDINLVRSQKERQYPPDYTPVLSTADYIALAKRTFPLGVADDSALLTSVFALRYNCTAVGPFSWVNLVWNVPDKFQPDSRRLQITVVIDAKRGEVRSYAEELERTSGIVISSEGTRVIHPDNAATVLQAAFDKFAISNDAVDVKHAVDCTVSASVHSSDPAMWVVEFESSTMQRHIDYSVDSSGDQILVK